MLAELRGSEPPPLVRAPPQRPFSTDRGIVADVTPATHSVGRLTVAPRSAEAGAPAPRLTTTGSQSAAARGAPARLPPGAVARGHHALAPPLEPQPAESSQEEQPGADPHGDMERVPEEARG